MRLFRQNLLAEDQTPGLRANFRGSISTELPERPSCWLFGHDPAWVDQGEHGGYAHCRRCDARPQPAEWTRYLQEDRTWKPSPTRVANLSGRDGWSRRQYTLLSWQIVVPRWPRPRFDFRLHVGNRASETPVDAHITIAGYALYLSTELLAGTADRLTGGHGPRYERTGRDISAELAHDPELGEGLLVAWDLWVPRRLYGEGYTGWRHGWHNLSVPMWLWGRRRFYYQTLAVRTVKVDLGDGEQPHILQLELQRQVLRRERGSRELRASHVVHWEPVDGRGIGYQRAANGTWSRDRAFGGALHVTEEGEGWEHQACAALRADVADRRASRSRRR